MAGIIRLGVNCAKMTLLGDALARRAIERRSSLWVALRCARGSIDDGTGDETHDQSWCFLYWDIGSEISFSVRRRTILQTIHEKGVDLQNR